MKLIVSGASGLVGSALLPYLNQQGHFVERLVRRPPLAGLGEIYWNAETGDPHPDALAGRDAVIHLAGESILGRWTPEKKRRIRESRGRGTRALSETLAAMKKPPRVLISASAIGYYGDRGGEHLTEASRPGAGFLPEVCREWEQATEPAARAGIRVVLLRIGIILSPCGGALAKMLPPFRLGLGGTLGDGHQYMSWVALDDILGIIDFALKTETLTGPVNAVAPHPATNYEFTKTLGRVLHRPTLFPLPAFLARAALGEMADALLLASTRVEPTALAAAGYPFRHPELAPALRSLLEV